MNKQIFLIPNTIAQDDSRLPAGLAAAIAHVRLFFVEEPKSARRLLKQLNPDFPLQQCQFFDLNEHTKPAQIKDYVTFLQKEDGGIVSESGCPCVADPGSDLVLLAHQNNIEIVPLVGPSSILLALMSSGLNGQSFAFNGYLPKEQSERIKKIKALEKRALQEGQTQIFMETPYRNQNMFDDLIKNLEAKTFLCIACDIQGPQQLIRTKTVEQWRKSNLSLPKAPALFIIK
jgi:16S rRNA (cytidine1402-2'-O)-methyltransferase